MRQEQKKWYRTASRIFAVVCALAAGLLALGCIFCVQDYLAARAAGESYPLADMLAQGLAVCGLPAVIAGALAVRFRDKAL